MEIRPYQPEDDPQLMALERKSARGFPKPFVHFRRKFIDRANLYEKSHTLVAIIDDTIVGVTSIVLKNTFVGGLPIIVAYSFDTRVHPAYRRLGIGHMMVDEKLKWAKDNGAAGVYSLIVTTNQASLGMVAKSGYERIRIILYLQFQPYPMLDVPSFFAQCTETPTDRDLIDATFYPRDLYVPYVAKRVKDLDFQRWTVEDENNNYAALSVFNQSLVSMQISAEAPWPQTQTDIDRLGRNLQIFDEVGVHNKQLFATLFQWIREDAVVSNVNKLTWLVDRADPIPTFVLEQALHQKDYWLLFKSFTNDWNPQWSERVYLDPRDL